MFVKSVLVIFLEIIIQNSKFIKNLYLSKDIIRMEQMLTVGNVFFPVQIAQMQRHALAV
jgi:hypothetical protein